MAGQQDVSIKVLYKYYTSIICTYNTLILHGSELEYGKIFHKQAAI